MFFPIPAFRSFRQWMDTSSAFGPGMGTFTAECWHGMPERYAPCPEHGRLRSPQG